MDAFLNSIFSGYGATAEYLNCPPHAGHFSPESNLLPHWTQALNTIVSTSHSGHLDVITLELHLGHSRFAISTSKSALSAPPKMSRDIPTDLPTGKSPWTGGRIFLGIAFSGLPTLTPMNVEDFARISRPDSLLTSSSELLHPSSGIPGSERFRQTMSASAWSPETITYSSPTGMCSTPNFSRIGFRAISTWTRPEPSALGDLSPPSFTAFFFNSMTSCGVS